jgi:hypothetical protein
MRGRRAWGIAALALGLGSAVLPQLAVDGRSHARELTRAAVQSGDCRVGSAPTHDYGERPPEELLRYGTRPVVIGCATLASGRRLELVGYQLGRGEHTSLCIDHYDFESGVSWGCGSNLVSDGGAIDATSKTGLPGRPDVVSGTLSASVARVVVRSEIAGRLRRHPSVAVRVRGRRLLRAIAVSKPFGRYLAEVPRGARAATAEALDARGRSLGLAFFPGFRGPVGQGRACYGRPRIARLRLLEPARAGRGSRVRVVARYQGGYIASIEAAVGGKGRVHADLVRPRTRRAGGRRVVTLPVRFERRGTVGVDVTAGGLPLSRRCGKDPPPRRSDPKTLVVRVR